MNLTLKYLIHQSHYIHNNIIKQNNNTKYIQKYVRLILEFDASPYFVLIWLHRLHQFYQ